MNHFPQKFTWHFTCTDYRVYQILVPQTLWPGINVVKQKIEDHSLEDNLICFFIRLTQKHKYSLEGHGQMQSKYLALGGKECLK